ncbi:glutathione S-transferase family protein [Pseudomonas hormoni]|uniref:Glutathione S-transferase family protein n=1 Tax=Pseudomonas hormoni TaxID=3093767 RepID=A0ABX8EQI0_9PSED|nr:glutathione S-transferase family protein [Pseudomonas hormoni]QVW21894.1 glutathione S-transferase family protein [Pseudomonas hormoni]
MSQKAIKLYRHPKSDQYHCVELMLSLLGLHTEVVSVDLMGDGHQLPEFLAGNSFGQVPFIDDDGTVVADCNAILVYLAATYGDGQWLPRDHLVLARVLCWLSMTDEDVDSKAGSERWITNSDANCEVDEPLIRILALLKEINLALTVNKFLVSGKPTIADVSAYSYLSHAPHGYISLFDYPLVREWLTTVSSLPRFVNVQRQERVYEKHDWNIRS